MDKPKPKIEDEIEKDLPLTDILIRMKDLRAKAREKYNKSLERFKQIEKEFPYGWNNRIKNK